MSNNAVNNSPYLRSSWDFPSNDPAQLVKEVSRSYISIAQNINERTIGIFPTNRPAVGGESWYLTSKKQQNFRQVYAFEKDPTLPFAFADIPHNIDFFTISHFTNCFGSALTVSGNWIGIIYASGNGIAGQITFAVISNTAPGNLNGVIRFFNTAPTPAIQKGIIVLQWLGNP